MSLRANNVWLGRAQIESKTTVGWSKYRAAGSGSA